MNGKRYLLDTNIIVDYLRNNKFATDFIDNNLNCFVSAIVCGELLYGAAYSTNPNKHLKQFNEFIKNISVLTVDQETAKYYGEIKSNLRKSGTPIPENDIWIAAIAIQHGFTLATNDKHFKNINSLNIKSI
jgi:tRNA(fMet)-specific endonuclease VapC